MNVLMLCLSILLSVGFMSQRAHSTNLQLLDANRTIDVSNTFSVKDDIENSTTSKYKILETYFAQGVPPTEEEVSGW